MEIEKINDLTFYSTSIRSTYKIHSFIQQLIKEN